MKLILNTVWLIFGGLLAALGWLLASGLMVISVVGLPWAPAAFRMAGYTLLPFGQGVVDNPNAGPVSLLGNIVWFVFAGWWLVLGHLILAVALAITIVGIPFAWAHIKLAGLTLAPVGKMVVRLD